MRRMFFLGFIMMLSPLCMLSAEDSPLWMRYAQISPDGQMIVFNYMGDIYVVSAHGGVARQLTTYGGYDGRAKWSPDCKHLAFASDREGSLDVFVMNAEGGKATRLTTHSSMETPSGWLDEGTVLVNRLGNPTVSDLVFPAQPFSHLYKVGIQGGRQLLYSELTMDDVSIDDKGRVLYVNVKGYEDTFRKHHTSAITRDVFLYADGQYRQLTSFKGEDRNPVWSKDGEGFYYLSEQDGTLNVYSHKLSGGDTQLTHFQGNPVRYLSASRQDLLCFCYDGEIYTQQPGNDAKKVDIRIVNDLKPKDVIRELTSSGASSVVVSPKGKEIAFILNNDVYVTSLEYKTTKQITDTPERERTVDFREDGRALVYDSERDGVWSIYQTELMDKDEKNFSYSTQLREERLTDGKVTSFQPSYSPDGKQVAYLENRNTVRVINLKNGKIHTVMDGKYAYSYSDGDQYFTWSPDSKWILADYIGTAGWSIGDVALLQADGKAEPVNLTESGYSDGHPHWVMGGRAMIFQSDRAGYRAHGGWGAERDEYIMFFDPEAYEEFRMNKEELALKKEAEEGDKKKEEKKDSTEEKSEKVKDLKFELTDLNTRTIRLTMGSTNLGDAVMDKEGTKLYYIAPYNGNRALWMRDLKEERNELRLQNIEGYQFHLNRDCSTAYFSGYGGSIKQLELATSKIKDIPFETFINIRPQQTQAYLFEHMWRQTSEKLFDPDMNGADWQRLHETYKRFLPHINNGYDFSEMMSEMLGELNVSHTGCRYRPAPQCLLTAELGALIDETYDGEGIRIAEVLPGGPLDTKTRVRAGSIITAIDGVKIERAADYFPLLAGKAGISTRLTLKGAKEDVILRPISSGRQSDLLYKRWVRRNEHIVDSLSGGRLAYVHIKAMNGESFHDLYRELLSDKNRQRDAAIVDVRHNGGGWLHNDVCALLSGKRTVRFMVRGQYIGDDPYNRWVKPSCMLVCEDDYSNAHGTPWLYKELGIGKLIGTPMAGTMTAVWWENIGGYVFGIPMVGNMDDRGKLLENQELTPDIECYITPQDQLSGHDTQLETAVREMLK